MLMGKSIVQGGGKVGYVANANVYHIHNENWKQIRRRYEREAIALRYIMPEVKLSKGDLYFLFFAALLKDFRNALKGRELRNQFIEIIRFRWNQYYGSYVGNQMDTQLTRSQKYKYFYP